MLHGLWTVAAHKIEYAEEHARGRRAILVHGRPREHATSRAMASNFRYEMLDFRRCLLWPICLVRASLATLRQLVFAYHSLCVGIEDSQPEATDMNDDRGAGVAGAEPSSMRGRFRRDRQDKRVAQRFGSTRSVSAARAATQAVLR
jgi:hypothetical protein